MLQSIKSLPGTLNSWKEIAQYLKRGVRTLQRWEHELGLPVHRIGTGKRSPVFATAAELNLWLATVEINRSSRPPHSGPAGIHGVENPWIQSLRQSRLTMRNLRQMIAENTARQHRQTELVRERMAKLRSRISRNG